MSNGIIINLADEDRVRLDRIVDLLEKLSARGSVVELTEAVPNLKVSLPEHPAEAEAKEVVPDPPVAEHTDRETVRQMCLTKLADHRDEVLAAIAACADGGKIKDVPEDRLDELADLIRKIGR